MNWKEVRLQVDVPSGWVRLDAERTLTFQTPTGSTLRLTPMSFPQELEQGVAEEPLLSWALEQTRLRHLEGATQARVSRCRFGLCASLTFAPALGASRRQFWFLANDAHMLLVSLQGTPNEKELEGAAHCVETMRLVPATPFPN